MKAIRRTKAAAEHAGQWVALKSNRESVIVAGKNPEKVMREAQRKGFKQPILSYIPKKIQNFIGGV